MADKSHIPVLLNEVLELFDPKPGDRLLDATIGHAGHAKAYLQATAPDGEVVGLDADAQALAEARQTLANSDRVQLINANFRDLNDVIEGGGIVKSPRFSHILFDLGIGSHQLADSKRGFSFRSPAPLKMAYGESDGPDADELIQVLNERDLADLIRNLGEERFAGRIAKAMKASLPIASAKQLADIIAQAVPGNYERGRIHPATRTFQALRLAANRELEALESVLPQAVEALASDGILAVISFHSLEDRIVKNFFRDNKHTLEILTKKPLRASHEETKQNPRARSAKLRAAKKKNHDTKHSTERSSQTQAPKYPKLWQAR